MPECSTEAVRVFVVTGEAIPSIVILCVMREMPPRSRNNSVKGKTIAEESLRSRLNDQSMVSDSSLFPQWTISATGQSYLIHPARSSSDISITRNEVWLISLQLIMFVRGDTAMKIALLSGVCSGCST